MTLSKRGLVAVGVLTMMVGLVTLFPARVAYQWFSSPLVSMRGIEGTVWSGSAHEFATNGVYLSRLSWDIKPLRLFTGKAVYDISGTPVTGFLEGEIAISLGGTVALYDLAASMPLQMLEQAANVAGLRGTASLQFERLELIEGRPAALDGSLDIANLTVPMINRGSLGGYRAEFSTLSDGIVGSIQDTDGVIDLAGSLQIGADGSYQFLGKIQAKPNTPEALSRQIQFLPAADDSGKRELRLEGSF